MLHNNPGGWAIKYKKINEHCATQCRQTKNAEMRAKPIWCVKNEMSGFFMQQPLIFTCKVFLANDKCWITHIFL